MKRFKKMMAIAIVAVMTLAYAMPMAFAEGEHAAADADHTLTITSTNNLTAHTYQAYQIFKGVLDGQKADGVDSHPYQVNLIQWGDNVNSSALLNALKADTTNFNYVAASGSDSAHNDFTSCKDAADVAAVLATYSNDDANMRAFAAIVGNTSGVLTGTPKEANADAGDPVIIEDMADGYYFIQDKATSQDVENGSYTRFVLQVVGDTAVTAKDMIPDIEKEIAIDANKDGDAYGENDTVTDSNSGSIGDKVNYKVTGTVPDMDGYESYLYKITDTMSKGLTFNEDAAVKIGDTTLSRVYKGANGYFYSTKAKADAMSAGDPAGVDAVTQGYTIDSSTDPTTKVTTFTIYIVNFIQYNVKVADDPATTAVDESENSIVGKPILVTYSATINQDALVADANNESANAGNTNTAKLTYSNNPNKSGKGTPGEPLETNPTGDGPDKTVTTYTTGIELLKVDGQDTSKNLAGAAFKLTGDAVNVTIVENEMYVKCSTADEADTTITKYWMLKDGTYSTDDPTTPNMDTSKYEDTTTKYKKITTVTKEYNGSETEAATGVTGTDGMLEFTGLGEGLYKLTETAAPTGYNLLENPIYVYVKFTQNSSPNENTGTFTVYRYKDSATAPAATDYADATALANTSNWTPLNTTATGTNQIEYDMTVLNNSGSSLPSTGGIGTTMFYLIGALLIIGAGVLLVTRRRVSDAE